MGCTPKAFPEGRGSGGFVGCSLGLAGGRYRLIMSCIDRERFAFMNEPAHSWPQLSVQPEVIAHFSSSQSIAELQPHGLWPKNGVCKQVFSHRDFPCS